jgi:hypothetical protein
LEDEEARNNDHEGADMENYNAWIEGEATPLDLVATDLEAAKREADHLLGDYADDGDKLIIGLTNGRRIRRAATRIAGNSGWVNV